MAGPLRRPSWGWHQLTEYWGSEIVAAAQIRPGSLVLDIGAGSGALTEPLVQAKARVMAFELNRQRHDELARRFAGRNVQLICADAGDLRLPKRPFHVVSNPPFSITTPLMPRLLVPNGGLVSAHVVLQRNVARNWAAGNVAGASKWWRHFELSVEMLIPRSAFDPRPQVDTALLVVRRRR